MGQILRQSLQLRLRPQIAKHIAVPFPGVLTHGIRLKSSLEHVQSKYYAAVKFLSSACLSICIAKLGLQNVAVIASVVFVDDITEDCLPVSPCPPISEWDYKSRLSSCWMFLSDGLWIRMSYVAKNSSFSWSKTFFRLRLIAASAATTSSGSFAGTSTFVWPSGRVFSQISRSKGETWE